MSMLYKRLLSLCEDAGVSGYRMSKDAGVPTSLMTDLKMGRRDSVSAKTADKLAKYFNVSVSYLLGTEEEKPTAPEGSELSDEKQKLFNFIRNADEDQVERIAAVLHAMFPEQS